MFGKLGFLKIWSLVIFAWGFRLGKNVHASTAEGLFRKKQSKMASILTCNFDISYLISSLAEMSKYTRSKPFQKPYPRYQIELGTQSSSETNHFPWGEDGPFSVILWRKGNFLVESKWRCGVFQIQENTA